LLDKFTLRDVHEKDAPAIAALNNAAVPNVNALEQEALFGLAEMADYARVAVDDTGVLGMMLAFGPGASYDSLNYRWFDERHDSFLYVDRVVVAESARGCGVGKRLYADLTAFAESRSDWLACEVNERPSNPGSMRFHEALGFRIVGRQETEGGTKSVALMLKPLPQRLG